ncbi:hypothetical protein GHNINEIG_00040 [Hydrogenovibrio crunogenus]|uniref:Uncharacterized protein n=1 Tax=Hydrogenovibrio crunogenus TaxID=39765 RepID=A0A4P7NWQ9_9GAMM|nr:hypothetical protein [Hydrogenovibrio crunogenus]QBZ82016.1 hypothetical protein GHNINEIG_00040 [Hydrogenovibrio crunogenus]
MLKKLCFIGFIFPALVSAGTNNIDYLNFESQSQFKEFAKDLTGALSVKTLEPAEPLGVSGFDIGISYNLSQFKYDHMDRVSNNGKSSLDTFTIHAVKGLPFGVDFGINYTKSPGSNIETWGGKLSYALIEGGALYPAIGISGNYAQTSGIDALKFNSFGAEVGVSKGFANFTPYAAVGMVNGETQPEELNLGLAGSNLKNESVSMAKFAVGVNINLLLMDVLVGYNQIGEVGTYSLKAGYRF